MSSISEAHICIPDSFFCSRFEEAGSESEVPLTLPLKQDSKKRSRESDATDGGETKLSKTQQKKLNKKLKAEGGKAVPTGEEQPDEAKKPAEKEEKKKEQKTAAAKGETKELSGGVKIRDHKLGSGPQAKNGDMVSVRYVGKLQNGKVFDSNTKGTPVSLTNCYLQLSPHLSSQFKFRVGKGEVIKGWDIGVVGMQPGGERLFTIPPAMAYGKRAQGGIPANSTLTFGEFPLLDVGRILMHVIQR